MAHVRILARPNALDAVVSAAFDETSTIGIRHSIVDRSELRRDLREIEVDGRRLRIKSAERPGGRTVKVEADDIATAGGDVRAREALRRKGEAAGS
jgi:pyridinium-3,5-bisthiocarboxylic acid mononucleotide nickel chelatase